MKKIFLSLLFSLFIIPFAFSQDIITTKSGEEINAKVLEISTTEVKFTTADKTGVMQSLLKANVFMIKYENGYKEVFQEEKTAVAEPPALGQLPTAPAPRFKDAPNYRSLNQTDNLYLQGTNDASMYYRGYKGAATGTLVVSILSPIAGLVPALITSVSSPSGRNLSYPSSELYAQAEYARGYNDKARKMKSKKVWTNFGIGAGIGMILGIMVASGG